MCICISNTAPKKPNRARPTKQTRPTIRPAQRLAIRHTAARPGNQPANRRPSPASQAKRQPAASHGKQLAPKRQPTTSHGKQLAPKCQPTTSHGKQLAPKRQPTTSHGKQLAPKRQQSVLKMLQTKGRVTQPRPNIITVPVPVGPSTVTHHHHQDSSVHNQTNVTGDRNQTFLAPVKRSTFWTSSEQPSKRQKTGMFKRSFRLVQYRN